VLVIRCREGESIGIGDDVEVVVIAAGPGRVKLGFKAPLSVLVQRRCLELTRQQNHAAVHGTDSTLLTGISRYLGGTGSSNLSYMISLPPASDVVNGCERRKENPKTTIDREIAAEE
jgi:carbon storage regulator CsrA